jgi:hypothetical protein
MAKMEVKRFTAPDEDRQFTGHGHLQLLNFGKDAVGLATFEPGWVWANDVKPLAGTRTCEAAHACYVLAGRMRIDMDDGESRELGPGDFAVIPPGHNAEVLGNEACRMLDFNGAANYAQRSPATVRENARPEARPH